FFVLLLVAFATAAGVWALRTSPLDALPDLSDVQVIVFTDWPGRSPDTVEDQITYPIVTTMVSAPRVKYVRGESMFGYSFVNVVFEDGTDLYWARSRVLEYLQGIGGRLPAGVTPQLGPDATGVGWVYEYALVDRSGRHSLAELRSLQDWTLRYALASVPGVAEVASVGGFVKQYQVEVDPATLRGYVESVDDLRRVAVGTDGAGTPIRLGDIARVHLGPELRRGLVELDGRGEAVGGVVVMRLGANALDVIAGVKQRLAQIALPPGVE